MSEAPAPRPPRPPRRMRRPRWMAPALAVSLGLNLLVAGFVAGAAIDRADRTARPDRLARELGLGPYVVALRPEDRRAIGRAVREAMRARGGPQALRDGMRQGVAETLAALRAEPFDPGRLAAALEAQVARADARRALGQQSLVARLAALPPAERRAFADRLEARLARGAR